MLYGSSRLKEEVSCLFFPVFPSPGYANDFLCSAIDLLLTSCPSHQELASLTPKGPCLPASQLVAVHALHFDAQLWTSHLPQSRRGRRLPAKEEVGP